jgi:hypothetical protein
VTRGQGEPLDVAHLGLLSPSKCPMGDDYFTPRGGRDCGAEVSRAANRRSGIMGQGRDHTRRLAADAARTGFARPHAKVNAHRVKLCAGHIEGYTVRIKLDLGHIGFDMGRVKLDTAHAKLAQPIPNSTRAVSNSTRTVSKPTRAMSRFTRSISSLIFAVSSLIRAVAKSIWSISSVVRSISRPTRTVPTLPRTAQLTMPDGAGMSSPKSRF